MSGAFNAASLLSDELWVEIVSHLAPEPDLDLHTDSIEKLAQDQRNLYRVRSVCSRFNKLFHEFPKLSSCLILEGRNRGVRTASLLAWLKCHGCCVETVMTERGTPALEMVLGALVTQPQHLKSLALAMGPILQSDLEMAASFTSLVGLGLSATDSSDDFDISALQALPHLHTLSLYMGEYCTKELPAGLLSLRLEDADLYLEAPTTCLAPLQNLKIIRSNVSSDHSDGILAYTTLQELYLDHGSIDSTYASDENPVGFGECQDGIFRCPDLSALRFVMVVYKSVLGRAYDGPIDWGCLYCLSSLQVTLLSSTQRLNIDQKLSVLGNLTCLTLIGAAPLYAHKEFVVSVAINVSWSAMPSIQNIYIESDRLQFGHNMLRLLQVPALRRVTFVDSKRATAELPANFAALVQGLVVERPAVTLTVNGSRKLAVYATICMRLITSQQHQNSHYTREDTVGMKIAITTYSTCSVFLALCLTQVFEVPLMCQLFQMSYHNGCLQNQTPSCLPCPS